MDFIRSFDIRLDRDVYYAGEQVTGVVILENAENIKIRGIRVLLRGKAHAEWKIMKSGERRTVKDDQYLLDDKAVIWGKDKHEDDGNIPILPRGQHQFPFLFALPQSALPCSFESKCGTIRYYIKVVIDIPYASPPQGIKYFSIIGPHIDCMDEKYLTPMVGQDRKTTCWSCCRGGPLGLRVTLERTAYVCGENIRLHAQIENQTDQSTQVKIRLLQFTEYFIDKGVLGVNKNNCYSVLEHRSPKIEPHSQGKYDTTLEQPIALPVTPPTLIGVCRLVQIYYVLKVCLENEKSGEDLQMEFPFTVATVPFRIPNTQESPELEYECCASHVEGGMYVSPEFQLGQVYDGTQTNDGVLLYRPVYVRVRSSTLDVITSARKALAGVEKASVADSAGNSSRAASTSRPTVNNGDVGGGGATCSTATSPMTINVELHDVGGHAGGSGGSGKSLHLNLVGASSSCSSALDAAAASTPTRRPEGAREGGQQPTPISATGLTPTSDTRRSLLATPTTPTGNSSPSPATSPSTSQTTVTATAPLLRH